VGNLALKVRCAVADWVFRAVQGRAARDTKGVADMKFRIYQYTLTAVVAAYTLVHTFGAKWG
jgi:hypothetical protein